MCRGCRWCLVACVGVGVGVGVGAGVGPEAEAGASKVQVRDELARAKARRQGCAAHRPAEGGVGHPLDIPTLHRPATTLTHAHACSHIAPEATALVCVVASLGFVAAFGLSGCFVASVLRARTPVFSSLPPCAAVVQRARCMGRAVGHSDSDSDRAVSTHHESGSAVLQNGD